MNFYWIFQIQRLSHFISLNKEYFNMTDKIIIPFCDIVLYNLFKGIKFIRSNV